MKHVAGIMLAFLAYGSIAQTTDPSSAPTVDEVYSTSVSAPVIASRCSQVFPGYENHFEPAFADWKNQHIPMIDSGREARKAKLEPGETIEAAEHRLASFIRIGLDAFQDAHLEKRCEVLLDQVGAPESGRGA